MVEKPTPKTQREISISQHEPYQQQGPGWSPTANPNSEPNRAEQVSFKEDTTKPISIGIQDIDEALMYYFKNVIKPFVIQNGERLEVPVIYGSQEKWKSFQKDGYYRDAKGQMMAPIIMFKRDSIEKNRKIANKLDANQPNNYNITGKTYSPKNTYTNFSVLNNVKPEITYYATVVPDYVNLTYSCVIFTYYIEQLNKIIEAIGYASDSYWGDPEKFKFQTRIDNFTTVSELVDNDERIVRSTFNIKMYGYIVPDTIQKDLTSIKKFSNKSIIAFTDEAVSNLIR